MQSGVFLKGTAIYCETYYLYHTRRYIRFILSTFGCSIFPVDQRIIISSGGTSQVQKNCTTRSFFKFKFLIFYFIYIHVYQLFNFAGHYCECMLQKEWWNYMYNESRMKRLKSYVMVQYFCRPLYSLAEPKYESMREMIQINSESPTVSLAHSKFP